LTDFGDPHYRQGLTCLIESAEKDAKLHFIGRNVMSALIKMFLVNRLLLAETRKRRPVLFCDLVIDLAIPFIILPESVLGSWYADETSWN